MIYYIDGQLFKLFLCCFMLNHKITPCYFLTLQLAQSFPSLIYVQDSQLLSRFSFAVCTCIILMYLYCYISVYIKQEEFLKKNSKSAGYCYNVQKLYLFSLCTCDHEINFNTFESNTSEYRFMFLLSLLKSLPEWSVYSFCRRGIYIQ